MKPRPKTNRDDFSPKVKRIIAQRVNYHCSRCDAGTSGPRLDPTKSLSTGVAGHITAAAPGGPRYNPSLTPAQRKDFENAIWLCRTCGTLVDCDESMFTVEQLVRWKRAAEARALAGLSSSAGDMHPASNRISLSPEEIEILIAAEGDGEIAVPKTELGFFVRTSTRQFIDSSDRAIAAIYLDAFEGLRQKGMIRPYGGIAYDLTGSGVIAARNLKKLQDGLSGGARV